MKTLNSDSRSAQALQAASAALKPDDLLPFGNTDQWLVDWAEAPVEPLSVSTVIPIPVHDGYKCVAAFSPSTNGWVGYPYVNTRPEDYKYGSVTAWYTAVGEDTTSLTVSCCFLYFKTGDG